MNLVSQSHLATPQPQPPAQAALAAAGDRVAIGYASGAFDLFHIGHLRYLEAAAARCRQLVVGVPADHLIAGLKHRPPAIPQPERLEIIAALRCVSRALAVDISMDDAVRYAALVAGLGAEAVFIGADWQGSPRWERLEPVLQTHGIPVIFLPRTAGVSTTAIRARITGQDRPGP